jgi:hypothetical protein
VQELADEVANFLQATASVNDLAIGAFTPAQPELPSSFGITLKQWFTADLEQKGVQVKRLTRYSCKGEYAFSREEEKVVIDVVIREGAKRREIYTVEIDGVTHLAALVQGRPKLHVAVLAADAYPGDLALTYPMHDGDALSKALTRYTAWFFDPGRTLRLVNEELTAPEASAQLAAMFDELQSAAKPHDLLVIYLAGHGAAFGEEYFFVPPHARLAEVEDPLHDRALCETMGMAWSALIEQFHAIPCRTLALIDTEYAGAAVLQLDRVLQEQQPSEASELPQVIALAACAEDGFALEADGDGYFVRCLRDGLAGEGDGVAESGADRANGAGNGEVDVAELLRYVTEEIPRRTRARGLQTPLYSTATPLDGWRFPLSAYHPTDLPPPF